MAHSAPTLRSYQQKVIKHMRRNRGVIALHSTGTGKTVTAVACARDLIARKAVTRAIALVNKSIIEQFWAEIRAVSSALERRFDVMTPHRFANVASGLDLRRCMLIVDEAHHHSNASGVLTRAILEASRVCPRVLLLSATVFRNDVYDIAPLLAMVAGSDVPPRSTFVRGGEIDRRSVKAMLRGRISVHLIDKNKRKSYPTLVEHDVLLRASAATRAKIQKPSGPFMIHERMFGLGACPTPMALSNDELVGCCEKCAWTLKRVRAWIRKREKCVLYAPMLEAGVHLLANMLENEGVGHRVIDGSTPAGERAARAAAFNAYPNREGVPVLVISPAGAESMDLKGVRHVVMMAPSWTHAFESQIIGRAQRYRSHAHLPPSQRTVDVWKLCLTAPWMVTADVIMSHFVKRKRAESNALYAIAKSVSI